MRNYLLYELRNRRGAMLIWGLGVGSFVLMYSVFYPALPSDLMNMDLTEIQLYQAFGQLQMNTFEAYFSSTILNFLVLLLAIFAVVNGSGALVGEEERGTLELLATLPLPRWQIVLGKALAMTLALLVIMLITVVIAIAAFFIVAAQMELTITAGDLVLPLMNAWPITVLFMMISLFFSALLPTRKLAAGAAVLVLIVSFLGNNLLPMVEAFEPFTVLLPFHYYNASPTVFTDGLKIGDTLILLGAAVVFGLLAIFSFDRRDLTTGAWFWQRGRV